MTILPVQACETAPEASRPHLSATAENYGFIPNLAAVSANSLAIIEADEVLANYIAKMDLTPAKQKIVLMTHNSLNGYVYFIAVHSMIVQTQSIPVDVISAVRDGKEIADPNSQALHTFTTRLNEALGHVSQPDVDVFLAESYTDANILDVILGTSLRTMSNSPITPLDAPCQGDPWTRPTAAALAVA